MKQNEETQTQEHDDIITVVDIYLQLHHNCVLCDSKLIIDHSIQERTIIEKAQCPTCKLEARNKEHIIQ